MCKCQSKDSALEQNNNPNLNLRRYWGETTSNYIGLVSLNEYDLFEYGKFYYVLDVDYNADIVNFTKP